MVVNSQASGQTTCARSSMSATAAFRPLDLRSFYREKSQQKHTVKFHRIVSLQRWKLYAAA